jgi:hypothetical protein
MSSSPLDRAKAWTASSTHTQEELLNAHNNLVMRVRRGAESAAAAELALDHLGEAYVDAGGDPLELLSIDAETPVPTSPSTTQTTPADTSSLVNYDQAPAIVVLDAAAKRQAFDALRSLIGTRHVNQV